MSEVHEELKDAAGKKPCAELPPTNPDAEEESNTVSESEPTPNIAPPPEPVVETPSPPVSQFRGSVQQEVQETNNSSTVAILIFFFTALFFGLAYRRLISIQ